MTGSEDRLCDCLLRAKHLLVSDLAYFLRELLLEYWIDLHTWPCGQITQCVGI